MEDMETVEVHNGLYSKVNEVATNVALTMKDVAYLVKQVETQNGRVGKNELRIDELEKVNLELLNEMKKFNTSEIAREKSRKSVKIWIVDNTTTIAIILLTGYLLVRFGWR